MLCQLLLLFDLFVSSSQLFFCARILLSPLPRTYSQSSNSAVLPQVPRIQFVLLVFLMFTVVLCPPVLIAS